MLIFFFFFSKILIRLMLEVKHLGFDYPDKQLLQGVEFVVPEGGLLHLRGSNGAGKTTLLKLLSGMLLPTQGEIHYCGRSIHDHIAVYQQNVCYVGHKSGISQLLTVRENCRFDLHQANQLLPFDDLIKSFSLSGLEDVQCGLLSVGQRRRVGLLRLAMTHASLWLLDEPLVALDNDAIAILMASLNTHLSRGGLVVLTSHQNLPLGQVNYQEYLL
jgi:heme exporter protein A